MNSSEISIELNTGATSTKVATSTTSAPVGGTTAVVLATNQPKGIPVKYLVTVDVNTFVRKGTGTVTALSDGTDQILLANQAYRVELMEGEKMAFIVASGTGNAYITPVA